jgi:hypothetical protein
MRAKAKLVGCAAVQTERHALVGAAECPAASIGEVHDELLQAVATTALALYSQCVAGYADWLLMTKSLMRPRELNSMVIQLVTAHLIRLHGTICSWCGLIVHPTCMGHLL